MSESSRYIFLAGGLPFILLGLLHALYTPLRPDQQKGLSPRDAALREAMARETLFLTRRTTVWLAWVGFNFSHSLGAVVFGSMVVLIGGNENMFHAQAAKFLPFAVLVGGIYLLLAFKYWFRTPMIGIALGEACFVASCVLFVAA